MKIDWVQMLSPQSAPYSRRQSSATDKGSARALTASRI